MGRTPASAQSLGSGGAYFDTIDPKFIMDVPARTGLRPGGANRQEEQPVLNTIERFHRFDFACCR